MTKEIKIRIEEMAKQMASVYNPYIKEATEFMRGQETLYIWAGDIYTKEQLNAEYTKTAIKDMTNGYNERMVGYYDKWYRCSHADEGRAYDAGVKLATENEKCSEEFHIIPCMA